MPERATRCAVRSLDEDSDNSPKSLAVGNLCDVLPEEAAECQSAPCWNRTNNLLIKSQSVSAKNPWKKPTFGIARS